MNTPETSNPISILNSLLEAAIRNHDEELADDYEAQLREAYYREDTPAEEQLASSLAGFLETHGTDDANIRWLATLITSRLGHNLAVLASRDIDAELPDGRRHLRLVPDHFACSRAPAAEPK